METMTPLDFLDFRDLLYPASGFQSAQFREIEIRLGLPHETRLAFDRAPFESKLSDARSRTAARAPPARPSLLELLDAWLARTPFVDWGGTFVPAGLSGRGRAHAHGGCAKKCAASPCSRRSSAPPRPWRSSRPEELSRAIFDDAAADAAWRMSGRAIEAALLITLYRDEPALNQAFRLLQALMDVDETMTSWRYRHALMVSRMLGVKIGTGGSSGPRLPARDRRAARHLHGPVPSVDLSDPALGPAAAAPAAAGSLRRQL